VVKTGDIAQILSDHFSMLVKLHASHLGADDWLETSKPAHMRPRRELHETETDYHQTETKWSGDH